MKLLAGKSRSIHTALSVLTVVVLLILLVYTVVEFQEIAVERAEIAAEASAQNRKLLNELAEQAIAIRQSQAQARQAFRLLAQRNEELHGNDPDDAPDFTATQSSNPPTRDVRSGPDGEERVAPTRRGPEQREPEQRREPRDPPREREPEPRRSPRPSEPPDPPDPPDDELCVPVLNVCVNEP